MVTLKSTFVGVIFYLVLVLVKDLAECVAQQTDVQSNRPRPYRPRKPVHPCEKSSCYPATGNLLIGREDRLRASSTCGTRGRERFCIVSHLEEKKCFSCETNDYTVNDPRLNHRIGQIIYKNQPGTREQTWWQSENGKQNVTVQLDLEAEFHFTHLIIVFQTFRPAAMLIERSYDFGRTWHVYRYFAHKCHEAFPGIPRITKNITDVVCDERYSSVEPSKNGEVIFRVLPPQHNIENPYADHIQNMLKMTNLRINFTHLHNLGDTLLDDREEIQEKYYYAISNMVVRGSCSCYGHASHCVPLDDAYDNKIDMVHGQCECTHNTQGLNCEECKNFYNDLPWKPALGKQTNACKACNCNNHTEICHFDAAVYEQSGRVSGGVCDNCQHNTQGQHCEECIPFFYRDPNEPITSPYACRRCDCDPRGSTDEGICDSITDEENEAGKCHCKKNVMGRRCDTCLEGFWNLDANNTLGCQECTCNTLGTVGNLGCNVFTGECVCKRLVTGKDCNQCMPETYGLSTTQDGCLLCDCSSGGSYDNNCDVLTGQCSCRPNMQGRRCDIPKQNYFVPSLQIIHEAEVPPAECEPGYSSYGNCTIVLREPPTEGRPPWTGPGYTRVNEGNELVFTVDDIPKTMPYDVVVRYQTQSRGDWEVAKITIIRPDEYNPNGPCQKSHPSYEDRVLFTLPERDSSVVALTNVCFEQGKIYKIKLLFERQRKQEDNPAAQILIDSIAAIPRIEATPLLNGPDVGSRQLFEGQNCNSTFYRVDFDDTSSPECKAILDDVSIYVFDGATACNCNPTGSNTKKCNEFGGRCQCKPNVVGRQCDRCAPGYYGFGPEGCKACDCNSIGATDNNCDQVTGQCKCHPNTYGRMCDQCQPGYWNFPSCQRCECNGHAQLCDQISGECIDCADYTSGRNCERCIDGFYGDALLGSEVGCRECRCPDTVASGHIHSDFCQLDPRTKDMICYCREGYAGAKCDICAENYFGHPELVNGTCQPCNCNNNVDPSRPGNCDLHNGTCLQCLYETAGGNCQYCRDGFFGNALVQDCRRCDCDVLGTDGQIQFCDRTDGQCPCLKNVEGIRCDRCMENFWKIASGDGCEACNCDPVGSEDKQCNPYDGQCRCKDGFGGRQCNECQANFWGNPNVECHPCECDHYGSATQQCDRTTGQCKCVQGIGGYKCNECARGYLGQAPYCSPCGECFDNWDLILNSLREETKRVIEEAKQIKTTGATGAYTKEFDAMEKQIGSIRSVLNNVTISSQDIRVLENLEEDLRKQLNNSLTELQASETRLEDLYSSVNLANVALDGLRSRGEDIKGVANELKANSTQLQEANIEGALNLTRQAWQKANLLSQLNAEAQDLSANAERQCHRTEQLVNRSIDEFNALQQQNENTLDQYLADLQNLTSKIPDLNEQICDKRGDPCDSVCGGAGCGTCGGFSCENGALTRAQKALEYVKDAEAKIKSKEDVADDLIRSLSQAKSNATEAYKKAENALLLANTYLNRTKSMITDGNDLITNLTEILNNNTASPSEIKKLAEETLELKLQLDPEQIKELATKIDDTVSKLENVDTIIQNTRSDLNRVNNLKDVASDSNTRAENVLTQAKDLRKSLEEADNAQQKAKDAIKQANEDIALAKDDLEKIDGVTVEAQVKANETAAKVDELFDQLNKLQKNVLKNEFDAKEIKTQSEIVRDEANKAHEGAVKLKNNYRDANDSLTDKASSTESARARAQQLLQRASVVTVSTQNKLAQLQSMADTYQYNERELRGLQARIDSLNNEMIGFLDQIQSRSEYYRTCSS